MALFKPGFGISALSGKIGGTIYSRNREGMYAKAWADPTNPGTPDQVEKEEIWIDMSAAYNSLTIDELDQWRTYASQLTAKNRLGETYPPQARNVFSECYTNAALIGATPLTVPTEITNRPSITYGGDVTCHTDGIDLDKFTLNDTTVLCPGSGDGGLIISSSPILRPSVRNVNNQFRMIITQLVSAGDVDMLSSYIAKFGSAAPTGHVSHLKLRLIDVTSMLGSTRLLLNTTAKT